MRPDLRAVLFDKDGTLIDFEQSWGPVMSLVADAVAPGDAASSGPLDLNRASAAELEQLPGIGPALAARIVAHREAEGPFASPRDLLEVSGIGEKTLARFEDRLRVR